MKGLFRASSDLVVSLARNIEKAIPGRIQYVEKIIVDTGGKVKTDFDIELDNFVIEVTRGGGKGKASQVLNKIQPEASKEVVIFGPNLKPSVQKELVRRGIKFFTTEGDLINLIS